jgi:membrane-associated phospholipid phosphatase
MRQDVMRSCPLDNSTRFHHTAPIKEEEMFFHTPDWEMTLFKWINQTWQNPLFDILMPLFSSHAVLWTLAIVLAAIGLKQGRAPMTVVLGLAISIGVSDLTCSLIKESVGRVRPHQSVGETRFQQSGAWVALPEDFTATRQRGSSFPSAHAANAAAAALVLFAAYRRKAIWALPLVIGYSRIYLGKHFPVDILAGWATGLAVTAVLLPIYPAVLSRVRSRWIRYRLRI